MALVSITKDQLASRDAARQRGSSGYLNLLKFGALLTAIIVFGIVFSIIFKGAPAITWEFLTAPPKDGMTAGGIAPMIRGSILLMFGTFLLVIPLGVLGGVCLAEYAGTGKLVGFMRACVTSLAGTPSVIYGLFGYAFFVLLLKLGTSLMAGWLTLMLLAMPVIVLSTEQAIKSVPDSLVEAGYALGLSRWQTMWKIILPNALPGIATGLILSSGRAAGEAPPIILTCGIYFEGVARTAVTWETLKQPVSNLPYHVFEGYRQGGVIPERVVWGTCFTLIVFVLLLNLTAILLRARARSQS
ncbi:MAG: phosphate ABC transporter permease PstA [Fimbriimonas sp.]